MKLIIDFTKLEYRKPKGSFEIFINLFTSLLGTMVDRTPSMPPLIYRHKNMRWFFHRNEEMSYKELGKTIRFDDERANQALVKHIPRLGVYDFLSSTFYSLSVILFVTLELSAIVVARPVFNASLVFDILSSILMIVLAFIFFLLVIRISGLLLDRHFADTLALISGIYLLIYLEKETSLADPEARRNILNRIRILRRGIILLSLMFSRENDPWPAVHFKQMEKFVLEHERWVIAPQAQTLDDLRRDFSAFLEILVSGQYGNFEWSGFEEPQPAPEPKPAEKVVRFLASILPFVLLGALFLFPAQVKAIGFDNNIVTLFLLAWLLLAIDSGLKLGLVERGATFAKALKDLG